LNPLRRKVILAFIQARRGSSRLPDKILLDLAGEPMLARVVNRCRRAKMIDDVIIATTTNILDDITVQMANAKAWPFFRGSENDVLDRYYQAVKNFPADVIVRITADCPCISPELIDQITQEFLDREPLDYASNTIPPRTFPRGLDVEVLSFSALEIAWQEDKNPAWREHVTPFIYFNPGRFRLHAVRNPTDYSSMRWTVDTQEDYELMRNIYCHFGHDQFSWQDILKLLAQHPDWQEINRMAIQKPIV